MKFKFVCPSCKGEKRMVNGCRKCNRLICHECCIKGLCIDCYVKTGAKFEIEAYWEEKQIVTV